MYRKAHRRYLSHLCTATTLAALAATAACSDTAVTPAAPAAPPAARFTSAAATSSSLVSNNVKYHDGSAPHATGRSGSAHLEGLATSGDGGVTRLVITTGDLDNPSRAPGQISKAQLKGIAADGSLLFTQNRNSLPASGTQVFFLYGLGRGDHVQVQANVRGIDGRRTDVVTLSETVKLAPALEVSLGLPSSARVGTPVVIDATVSEVNGDMGTRANCVLYVDGTAVDRADNIWIDAGGQVSCAFSYTFTSTGSHTIEVRVDGAFGAGSLVANGGDTEVLDVGSGGTTAWTASVEDRAVTTTSVLQYSWWKPDGSHKEYSNTEVTTNRDQTFSVQGTMERPLSFPLVAMDLSMSSAGVEWETEHWTALDATVDPASGSLCVNKQMADQGTILYACNGLGGATFGYTRFAGNVTYHSYGYANTFDGLTGTPQNYSWNDAPSRWSSGGGQVRELGTAVQMRLSFQDLGGTFSFAPLVTLSPFSGVVSDSPLSCTLTSPESLEGGQQNWCTGTHVDESGSRGSAAG